MSTSEAEPERKPRIHPALIIAWRVLRELAGPALSAPALAVALALGVSLFTWWIFQFGTNFYEAHPGVAYLQGLGNVALAAALAVLMLLRPTWQRAHALMLGLAAVVAFGAIFGVWAKLQYRRGLEGNGFYTLPHRAFAYVEGAERVTMTTSDSVGLVGTLLSHRRTRALVFVPGWRTNRNAFSIVSLAQWLSNDFDVLVIDPRGQGESGGSKSPDGSDKNDVMAAVAYLHGSGHTRVGVLAEEDAAPAAIQAGILHEGIDGVALIAPESGWGESLGQDGHFYDPHTLPGRIYWRIAAGLRLAPGDKTPPVTDTIRFVSPTPLLLAACKTEPGTTIDQLHLAANEPKSLIVLGGSGLPTDWAHFAEYYSTVQQWFAIVLH